MGRGGGFPSPDGWICNDFIIILFGVFRGRFVQDGRGEEGCGSGSGSLVE